MGVLPATTALVDGPLLPSGGQGVKVLDLEGAAHHVEDLYPDPAVLASKCFVVAIRRTRFDADTNNTDLTFASSVALHLSRLLYYSLLRIPRQIPPQTHPLDLGRPHSLPPGPLSGLPQTHRHRPS